MDNTLTIVDPVHTSEPTFSHTENSDSSSEKHFITANTVHGNLHDICNEHIIPVFIKDNEPLISHADFIKTTWKVVNDMFPDERILKPNIRLSHPVKGRIPEAKDKPAIQLQDHERTIYYERMAFIIEIPSISDTIGGNEVCLSIGGVKAYSTDNLYSKKGTVEHFKIFIGFQNKVCTNLCVWSDGASLDLKVTSIGSLMVAIRTMIEGYNKNHHLFHLKDFCNYALTEKEFATLIGRCRMYNHLPSDQKVEIPPLLFGDTQIGSICKDYYKDNSFCKDELGNINLWKLYNLFTGANKSSYIDSFAERSISAFSFIYGLKQTLQNHTYNWYLN